MPKKGVTGLLNSPRTRQILLVFSMPKTPKQAETELSIRKLKLKPFLEKNLLRCLSPEAKKGRFYIVSEKAKKLCKITELGNSMGKDWELIGWIVASPKQRLAVLRVMDARKLTSEEIRARGTQFNASLTRISTKSILRELVEKHLVDTEVVERMRFYWLNNQGIKTKEELSVIAPISPLFSLP